MLNNTITNKRLEEFNTKDIKFHLLSEEDYDKGYFELLMQLTKCEKASKENFCKRLELIRSIGNTAIVVGEKNSEIVSSISLIFEYKFIRNLGVVCHVEDVIVSENCRGFKLGTKILDIAKILSKENGCYKIILDCDSSVRSFYEKQGFIQKSNGMALYFV